MRTDHYYHFPLPEGKPYYNADSAVLIAAAAVLLLKKIKFSTAGFDMVFVVGIAVIGYALPAVFGGNGFLSVYIVGIVLGNTEIRNKRNLVNFFDGLTGLMQMLIFFLLGLLAFPSRLPKTPEAVVKFSL